MLVKVVLVDINPKMVEAWRATFEENPEVEIVQGSMLEQTVDAWVTPTNCAGEHGRRPRRRRSRATSAPAIERRVQAEIAPAARRPAAGGPRHLRPDRRRPGPRS